MPRDFDLIDLSHTFSDGTLTYPGLPVPRITPHLSRATSRTVYAEGTEFQIDSITMVGNTGTYIDSPFHRYADGPDLSELSLETLVDLPTVVIRHPQSRGRAITVSEVEGVDVEECAVLFDTGWSIHFGEPEYGIDAPFVTADTAAYLADHGAVLVGIDSVNIDDTQSGGTRPAHSVLLERRIHVVEHLTSLDALPEQGALFTAVPPKVHGFGTFPVRAYARIPTAPSEVRR